MPILWAYCIESVNNRFVLSKNWLIRPIAMAARTTWEMERISGAHVFEKNNYNNGLWVFYFCDRLEWPF